MIEKLLEFIHKTAEFILTPFTYPRSSLRLLWLTFTNRKLVRELVHLTPHRKWYRTMGFNTVLDVGAHIGAYAFALKHILPDAQVYSFEPLPDSFQTLIKNMQRFQQWEGIHTALGETQGTLEFWKNAFSASSSALPMENLHRSTFPQTENSQKVSVPVSTLDEVSARQKWKSPVLLKIDVQGYELAVLHGALQSLHQVDCVICEVSFQPLYKGQAAFAEVYQSMLAAGFKYKGSLENLLSPVDGSIMQADAVFMKQAAL